MQILKGHDHVIESVCFGKKPPTAAVPVALAVASLNLLDTSQKSGKTDDTSLVDIIGVSQNKHLNTLYFILIASYRL